MIVIKSPIIAPDDSPDVHSLLALLPYINNKPLQLREGFEVYVIQAGK